MRKILFILYAVCLVLCAEQVNLVKNGLFNDASDNGMFWRLRSGGLSSMSVVQSKEGGSNTFCAKVKDISPRPWTAELFQNFDTAIEKGVVVYLSFDYRISSGYSFNFYWQEERSPWPKLLSLHIDAPAEVWHRVRMAVPVHDDYAPGSTSLSFHLAEKIGKFELRNVSALVYPAGTNPEELESNVNPVFGGDFYDKDWRASAEARLEGQRKNHLTVNVMKRGNAPVAGAKVSLRQLSREMEFGVELKMSMLLEQAGTASPENRSLMERLGEGMALLPQYRKMQLDRTRFSFVTLSDGMLWRDFDAWGRKYESEALDVIGNAGLAVRGHALYVPAYMYAPVQCRKMTRAQLSEALINHVREEAASAKGRIREWNVIHGGVEYKEIYDYIGVESLVKVWKAAEESAPGAKLYYSDMQGLCGLSDVTLRDSLELVDWLRQSGCRVDGLVLGANMKRLDVAPQTMERRLNLVQKKLKNMPVHIANFAVNADTDEFQASIVRDYMLLFYSMGSVRSVSFAENWASALLNPKMALYTASLEPKPAAFVVNELLTDKWWTHITGSTDVNGSMVATVFAGQYELEVNGKKYQVSIPSGDGAGNGIERFLGGYGKKVKDGYSLNIILD